MALNPILEEIYAVREKLLNKFDNDLFAYVQDARLRAIAADHTNSLTEASGQALSNEVSGSIAGENSSARETK